MENNFKYADEAVKTLSDKFYGEDLDIDIVMEILEDAVEVGKDVDKLKKKLFYNKSAFSLRTQNIEYENFMEIPYSVAEDPKKGEVIIHGILGVLTESIEMLEALLKSINDDKPIDLVNLKEECGDVSWYLAILSKAAGFEWGEHEKVNIEKLRARFPNNFTEHDAKNRDLDKERGILEK